MQKRSANSLTLRAAVAIGAVFCALGLRLEAAPLRLHFSEPADATYRTDDGTVALAWRDALPDPNAEREFEVRRWSKGSSGPGVLVYEGPDTATFLSGLPEGAYDLRIRSRKPEGKFPAWGPVALTVRVKYIEGWLVATLMSVGLVTFVAILGTIILGHRSVRRSEDAVQP